VDPSKRISAEEALKHKFFNEVNLQKGVELLPLPKKECHEYLSMVDAYNTKLKSLTTKTVEPNTRDGSMILGVPSTNNLLLGAGKRPMIAAMTEEPELQPAQKKLCLEAFAK
jgi:hypothetical protein